MLRYNFQFRPKSVSRAAFSLDVAATPTMMSLEMMPIEPKLTPRDEAVFLLHTAAEIEHALLVQYLYATYSVTPEHAVWRRRIVDIAVQEMGHLVSMQNVLHFLGGPLTLDREDFPFRGNFYPFHFKLEPLSLDSLAKYVVTEMPEQEITTELNEIINRATEANANMEVNRVGALFERIDKLFDDLVPDDTNPKSANTVQATPAEWHTFPGGPVIVETVRTLGEARSLLNKIAVQGEGGDMSSVNHYMMFLEVYREVKANTGGPPSLPIPSNPNTSHVQLDDPGMEAGRITAQEARRWAHVGNLRYRMLLAFLLHSLHLDRTTSASARTQLTNWTFQAMRGSSFAEGIKGINDHLMSLPQHDPPVSEDEVIRNAAIPFQLPYSMEIPTREADRWRLHLDLLDSSKSVLDKTTTGTNLRDRILDADDDIRMAIKAEIAALTNGDTDVPLTPMPPMMPAPTDGTGSNATFIQLMRSKQSVAQFVHSGIQADGTTLSDAFANEDYTGIIAFLTTAKAVRPPFEDMALVTPGNPSKSALFLHLSEPGGTMAGIFSDDEQNIVEQWIRDLPVADTVTGGVSMAVPVSLKATEIVSGLSQAVFVTAPPNDSSRIFIVEKTGDIKIFDLASSTLSPQPFLTVDDLSTNSERGLLGLAFHPHYDSNGQFYVNCTDANGRTTIRRYLVSNNPAMADTNSRQDVLGFDQPFANHNAGWIAFGPNDGMLYIATGDGGSGNDPFNNAQNVGGLLGKVLRVDVEGDDFPGDLARNYAIPQDNPFANDPNVRKEIWAFGLRNPWRCSFDREIGDLYIGDVGQSNREEINFQPAGSSGGENYGWRIREGSLSTGLDPDLGSGFVNPIFEYGRSDGRAIVGGYVYRGSKIAGLAGTYFYMDFVSNRVWTFRFNGSSIGQHMERTAELSQGGSPLTSISSFGEDANGELYITLLTGKVFRIEG